MKIDTDQLQQKLLQEISLPAPGASLGVDCEELERWRRLLPLLDKQPDCRMFTEREHEHCLASGDAAASYAGRWCAKEAIFKALSPRYAIDLRQIEILADQNGRPLCVLPLLHPAASIAQVQVSISHTQSMAMAFALVQFLE